MAKHGRALMRAVLQGFAGVAPRSAVPNLIEMLGTLVNRSCGIDGGSGTAGEWMREILFSVCCTLGLVIHRALLMTKTGVARFCA